MNTQAVQPWQEMLTDEQRRFLNAICGDLAQQINWHGNRLTKDDWRHFIAGTVLGWRMMPAYDRGEGAPGFVMLGGSSLNLRKAECVEAITMALHIGDHPEEQRLNCKRVRWSDTVLLGLGFNPADFREAA
jgi:hypothetical protein